MYNILKTILIQFFINCFFENIKCWHTVKTSQSGIFFNIIIKMTSCIAIINHLVFCIFNLIYLLRSTSTAAAPTSVITLISKWSGYWEDRAAPCTPSKKPRLSDLEPANPSVTDVTSPDLTQDGRTSPSAPISPSTIICLDEGPLTSDLALASGAEPQLHRNRCPLGKYADMD